MKVLLIDDDVDQLAVRAMLLAGQGYDPITAPDAASGLEAARSQHPACAVLDLSLPTTEVGLEALRELRRSHADLPVIVLTGYPLNHRSVMEARQYASDVIGKGSGVANLLARLSALRLQSGSAAGT